MGRMMEPIGVLVAIGLLVPAADLDARAAPKARRRPSPAMARPAAARPTPRAQPPARWLFRSPILGLKMTLPASFAPAPAGDDPVSVLFLGPHDSTFRANINVVVEARDEPLERYLASMPGRAGPDAKRRAGDHRITVRERPASRATSEFTYRLLPLKNIQVVVDGGATKCVLTGTSLANRFPELERTFLQVLDSLEIVPREPLDRSLGPAHPDPSGRFIVRPPRTFTASPPRPRRLVAFHGPFESGYRVGMDVTATRRPPGFAPGELAATLRTLRRRRAEGASEGSIADGRIETWRGLPPGLRLFVNGRVNGVPIVCLLALIPAGDQLLRFAWRCPASSASFYLNAFEASVASVEAPPAPAASPPAATGKTAPSASPPRPARR
jgi:hypothetical protein